MTEYLLALREDPDAFQDVSPAEMEGVIARYMAWAEAHADRLVAGHKLADGEGRVVRRAKGDLAVTDGPYSETKEILGGFYIIRAESYEDALAVLADHPHADYGSIELRAVDPLGEGDDGS